MSNMSNRPRNYPPRNDPRGAPRQNPRQATRQDPRNDPRYEQRAPRDPRDPRAQRPDPRARGGRDPRGGRYDDGYDERDERELRYRRKKKNYAPLIVLGVSFLFIITITIIVLTIRSTTISPPTNRTMGKLGVYTLPAAPQFPGSVSGGDANAKYKQAIRFYIDNHAVLNPSEHKYTENANNFRKARELAQLMVEAANMQATQPFLDDHVVISFTDKSNVIKEEAATIGISSVLYDVVQEMANTKNEQAKFDTIRAIYVYGQRQFSMSRMLPIRSIGLDNIYGAIDLMNIHYSDGKKYAGLRQDLSEYQKQVDKAKTFFNGKKRVLQAANPHVGDLLNIALNDEDYGFRLEAVRRMAFAKWNPGTVGNRNTIEDIIAEASQSSDRYMKLAAETAKSLTKDQFHTQR